MKNRLYLWCLVIAFAFLGWWLLARRGAGNRNNSPIQEVESVIATDSKPAGAMNVPAAPPNDPETNTSGAAAIADAYEKGLISRGEAVIKTMMEENNNNQDFYGKVIDQHGQPVGGAEVTGEIVLIRSLESQSAEIHKAITDSGGLFQFTGLSGWKFHVSVNKDGYKFGDRGEGYQGPVGEKPSPNDRAILTMWKLKGAEPIAHVAKFFGINSDGRTYTIDLLEGKKIEGQNVPGDLLVRIKRPAQVRPREKFDWSFAMSTIDGGILEANGGYLYEAPENGYEQNYEVNMLSSDPQWRREIQKTFFLKSRGGRVYGHFQISVISIYRDASAFKIESYINPAGSRNLEFDPAKQVQ